MADDKERTQAERDREDIRIARLCWAVFGLWESGDVSEKAFSNASALMRKIMDLGNEPTGKDRT